MYVLQALLLLNIRPDGVCMFYTYTCISIHYIYTWKEKQPQMFSCRVNCFWIISISLLFSYKSILS